MALTNVCSDAHDVIEKLCKPDNINTVLHTQLDENDYVIHAGLTVLNNLFTSEKMIT